MAKGHKDKVAVITGAMLAVRNRILQTLFLDCERLTE